jgi:pimeloyl-ACP methyl ester carboxylesterase
VFPFHYQEFGKGQTVILLHGFAESSIIWNSIIDYLKNQFHLIALDLPGFGKSPKYKSEFQLIEIAQLIDDFLIEKDVKEYHLVGHSLGGYISLAMASKNHRPLKSLVLFHSTAMADTEEKIRTRNKIQSFIQKHGSLPFLESFIPPLFYKESNTWVDVLLQDAKEINPETLIAYTRAMRDRPAYTELLANLTCKIMVIAGDQDTILPIESLQKQTQILQKSHFLPLHNVGHMGMLELPEYCAKALNYFFSNEL